MSIPILQVCRKRKQRPKVFNFHMFGNPGCPVDPVGPFRENIHLFLEECGVLQEDSTVEEGMLVWCTLLMHEKTNSVVPFYTIQENVHQSSHPFCDHCRFAGWSNHYVSKRRYHLIIPVDKHWSKPVEASDLDVPNHLLHGLIHGNGFGHLLSINGIEGGSKFLCGREIMDLWDRICTNLLVRKITVEDVSKKRCMDLRLLYGVAYGHTWFGRWGYGFLRGSFGIKYHYYHEAIEFLSSLELDKILQDFRGAEHFREIKQIFSHYKDVSETNLTTLRELLRFMLTVKSRAAPKSESVTAAPRFLSASWKPSSKVSLQKKHLLKPVRLRKFTTAIGEMDSRWPARRLEQAAEVIINALKENRRDKLDRSGMARQDVRDAARLHIGDTGLLDNVLKILNNVIVGNYVVRRTLNPSTRILEYTICELGGEATARVSQEKSSEESHPLPEHVVGVDVYGDIAKVYTSVLLNHPMSEWVELATQATIDSKYFIKEWPFRDEAEQLLTFNCHLMPSMDGAVTIKKVPPGEIVMVPLHATIRDLKVAAERAFRETYCVFEQLVVTDIGDMEEIDDNEVLFGIIESGAEVWVRGSGMETESQLKYEGGSENWEVRCECGAEDDDGERMVACDICEVWHHTRCCGIEDRDRVPPLFVCSKCSGSMAQLQTEDALEFKRFSDFERYGCFLLPPKQGAPFEMELLY